MKEALAAAEKAARAHGFSLAEITGNGPMPAVSKKRRTAKPKNPGVAKYANPDNKTQTWTGKGRRPVWFVAAIQAGISPDDLAI
jgi:DNA-binding protein H-NS